MKGLEFINAPGLYLEIGTTSMKALDGDDGAEFRLERESNGRLTADCKKRVTGELQQFLKRKGRSARRQAYCSVGARGVSLRPLSLPATPREEVQRLLLLQIESEFPLPPADLSWGCLPPAQTDAPRNGAQQEWIVAAVKKEVIEEYAGLLRECGLTPVFTLSALARNSICPPQSGRYAVLEIGRQQSELIAFDKGSPVSVRTLAWGGDSITIAISEQLKVSLAEAEKLKINLDSKVSGNGDSGGAVEAAVSASLDSLAELVKGAWLGPRLYLAGRTLKQKDIPAMLARKIGGGMTCERLDYIPGEGRSAAVLGLKRAVEVDKARPMLVFQTQGGKVQPILARPIPWKLVGWAAALAIAWLAIPYLEALVMKPVLEKRIASINAKSKELGMIDREFEFLQYLKKNQPPYLEALTKLAASASSGTRIEQLQMDRRGDVAIRGTIQGSQSVTDFRSKLVDSGLFYNVVLEEQTPSQDRQKMTVRFTAMWRPGIDRDSILPEPVETNKSKSVTPAVMPSGPTAAPVSAPTPIVEPSAPPKVDAPTRVDGPPTSTPSDTPAEGGRRGRRGGGG